MIFFKRLPLLVLIVIFSLPVQVIAQQGNIWYFGEHAGLNFNTSPPSALFNGALNTLEGSSCISDDNGNILFYTDGSTVYNKNHQPMPNGTGLSGDYSSAQSAIIIPKPGSNTIYYIFTAAEVGDLYEKGYNYNIVDMTLDGGLGDIVQKNTLLFAPGTEKLNAIRHANGIDVWVMTKVMHSNIFKAYKIDCNGLDATPVISTSGRLINPDEGYADGGLLKFSPDGKKICQTFGADSLVVQLSEFNNATGSVFNSIEWSYPDTAIGVSYINAEFSPNSSLLYTGFIGKTKVDFTIYEFVKIMQYNITSHNSTAIQSTETLLFRDQQSNPWISVGSIGMMQIAPDNKIYISRPALYKIDVINNPNIAGTGCNYQEGAVDLGGKRSLAGLPTFIPNLFVNQQTSINFTVNPNCATVNFTASTAIPGAVNWQWDFGDGTSSNVQNPVHTYSNSGNIYTVILKVISPAACNGFVSIEKEVNLNRIVPAPGFYFQSQCGNPAVNFFDTSSIAGNGVINYRLWDFGDGYTSVQQNPQHTYSATGNYTVKLTVGNTNACGGNSFLTKIVAVETKPNANFTIKGGCAGSFIKFTDRSIITSGSINEWLWDFGDGSTSNLQHPEHTYSNPGTFTVTLKVKSQTGCWSDVFTKDIILSSKPLAKIGWQNTCANKPTLFSDSSSIATGNISNWHWDFGDGSNSVSQNPQHIYTIDGNYSIKMVATSSTSCNSDTLVIPIEIGSKPIADISNTYACGVKTVSFKDSSTNSTGIINKWNWDFGDGNTGNIQYPEHNYSSFGNYTAKLVVSTDLGCSSDTVAKLIAVNAKPVALPGAAGGCLNQPITFADSSFIEAGSIANTWWSLGDGTLNSNANFTHVYTVAAFYTVKLVVQSNNNCMSDTSFKKITVEEKPVVQFTVENSCVDKQLILQNNTSIGNGVIARYFWDFGNGNTSQDKLPNYSYSNFGNFTIKLVAASKNNCISDTASRPVKIESLPVVDFDFGATCTGKPISFKNLSSNSFGNITNWKWDFGNNASSASFEPLYTYDQFGNFPVSLTANTINGCSNSKVKNILISKVNVFAGNDTIVAINQPLQLRASGAAVYTWTPNFYINNGNIYNPVATLTNDNTYYLQGTTAEGCIGYDTINIKVYKGPEIYVPAAFTPNGDNLNETLKPIIPGVATLEYFNVYNRWGQLVFSTSKMGEAWDGKFKGGKQQTDTYIWMCRVKDYTGKIIERKGSVLLIH